MESTISTPNPMHELAERTVTLADGRPGLRTALQISACSPPSPPPCGGEGRGEMPVPNSNCIPHSELRTPNSDGSQPVLDFIASSDTLDRYHEIIDAAGWRLDNYRRNPVFQNAHNYGDIIFTLGKALLTEVRQVGERQVLFQRIQFATDVNPMARIAYGLYRGGFLSAVSVGFIPLRWENADGTQHTLREAPDPSAFRTPNSELRTPSFRRKYLEQELLEVSAVGIPANPDALALGLKSGTVQKSDVHELLDLLHSVVGLPRRGSQGGRAETVAAGSASPPYPVELLSLARALRDLLRRS